MRLINLIMSQNHEQTINICFHHYNVIITYNNIYIYNRTSICSSLLKI